MRVGLNHARYARHVSGAKGAFAYGAIAKVLIVVLAFVLAVVARYMVTQWAEREYGDPLRANLIGWLAFIIVLAVVGLGGWKLL